MPLAILSREATQSTLEANQGEAGLPWALIRDTLFAFCDALREGGVFFSSATDSDAANELQPHLQEGKTILLNVKGYAVKVLCLADAQKIIDTRGAESFGAKWPMVQSHVSAFLIFLYRQNYFLTVAGNNVALNFVANQTNGKNLNVRLHCEAPD